MALLLGEPTADAIDAVLRAPGVGAVGIGAPTLVETSVVLGARLRDGDGLVEDFLRTAEVTVVAFDDQHWRLARSAYARFGRGRHPAGLNLGDCFSYATARVAGRPLLCVGDDFPRTDLPLVPLVPLDV